MTSKKPVLPVVEVDQAFPLMTTGAPAPAGQPGGSTDQEPAVETAIRNVLGWRPRTQDATAFIAALNATFQLSTVEGHREATYVPRGYAIQADLGGVTGGQASLYTRAQAALGQITRILDALKPLRTDADPEDCAAYRTLVRDSVSQLVGELGTPGGPRVELVDSAFGVLTGYQPVGTPGYTMGGQPGGGAMAFRAQGGQAGLPAGGVALAPPGTTADDVPGQLGALRDRFGLTDDNVNTVDEEAMRTSFLTLVDLIVDLQNSWNQQRAAFGSAAGQGFIGTELVLINRLLAAAAEQVDEVEAVLESALVSAAERQTIILNAQTRLTLDGYLGWLRTFLTKDGPRIARDTGRDGLTTSFTPTALALLRTLRDYLVARLVPCRSASCGGMGGCRCSRRGVVSYIPVGCCSPLPPGMYAGRTKIAISGLCGLLERLGRAAARIGRFSGAVLFDVIVEPFAGGPDEVRVEVRGLHLRPSYLPAFVTGTDGRKLEDLILPRRGSASADADSVMAVFSRQSLPPALAGLVQPDGAVFAAADIPLALVDGETGQIVTAPTVVTWPDMQPAASPDLHSGPAYWGKLPQDQRWVPQGTAPRDDDPEPDDCTEPCAPGCGDDCGGDCGCGCHQPKPAGQLQTAGRPGPVRPTDGLMAPPAGPGGRAGPGEPVARAETAPANLDALESQVGGRGAEEGGTVPDAAEEAPRDLLLSASDHAESARQKANTLADRLAEQRRQTAAAQERADYQRDLARAAEEARRAATETAEVQLARVAEFETAAREAASSEQDLSWRAESAEREARASEAVADLDRDQASERRVPEPGKAAPVAGETPATALKPTARRAGADEEKPTKPKAKETGTTTRQRRSATGDSPGSTSRRDSAPRKQGGGKRDGKR